MTEIERLLRDLRDEERHVSAPPGVEASVLAAWDAATASSTAARVSWSIWRRGAAAAAALAVAATLSVLGGRLRSELGAASSAPAGAPESPALLLLVGEPILRGESMRIVRMRVPASTLAALGVRSLAGEFADAVEVDVFIGEDGVARAIRLGM